MNDDTVLELNRNLADWRAGTLDPADEAYLVAFHARIVSGAVAEPIEEAASGPARIDGLTIEEWRDRALKAEADLAEIADASRAG